ncbi:MAG: cysteine dioxygenase family protein [Candidatus Eremiobacteraeota bacterium]|nr:cysteine dioxygenase family protein [Candidatus Eremiobacteraeota bacterium]
MIVSLPDLAEELKRIPNLHDDGGKVDALLRRHAVDPAALEPYVHFEDGAYTRNCVYRDGVFELLVLCWAPGARSAIHDHGGNRCWLVPQSGGFTIDDYIRIEGGRRPGPVRLEQCAAGPLELGDIDARGFDDDHDIHAVSVDRPSISLHVYAAPIGRFLVYDWQHRSCDARRFEAQDVYDYVI